MKFLGPDLEAVRLALQTEGAVLEGPRQLETNDVFDDEHSTLATSGRLLRLRDGHELTVKLPIDDDAFKARQEINFHVVEPGVDLLLAGLGYRKVFRYEKYREGWDLEGMWITLDELPFIGGVVEIEGDRDRILPIAERIGLGGHSTSTANYRGLYLDWARQRGVDAGDLTFAAERGETGD